MAVGDQDQVGGRRALRHPVGVDVDEGPAGADAEARVAEPIEGVEEHTDRLGAGARSTPRRDPAGAPPPRPRSRSGVTSATPSSAEHGQRADRQHAREKPGPLHAQQPERRVPGHEAERGDAERRGRRARRPALRPGAPARGRRRSGSRPPAAARRTGTRRSTQRPARAARGAARPAGRSRPRRRVRPSASSSPAAVMPPPAHWTPAAPSATTAAAATTRPLTLRPPSSGPANASTTGTQPMITPTVAGSVSRTPSITKTLNSTRPVADRATSPATSRGLRRGRRPRATASSARPATVYRRPGRRRADSARRCPTRRPASRPSRARRWPAGIRATSSSSRRSVCFNWFDA